MGMGAIAWGVWIEKSWETDPGTSGHLQAGHRKERQRGSQKGQLWGHCYGSVPGQEVFQRESGSAVPDAGKRLRWQKKIAYQQGHCGWPCKSGFRGKAEVFLGGLFATHILALPSARPPCSAAYWTFPPSPGNDHVWKLNSSSSC